jgi:hypothetical protein
MEKQKIKKQNQHLKYIETVGTPISKRKLSELGCCDILEVHHDLLKNDPERLSTKFIKKISKCKCGESK